MKSRISMLAVAALLLAFSASLYAQDPAATVVKGCEAEIKQFCSQVTPGEGRMLACFFAHEDKLSGQCQYALYTAAAQLEDAINALNYVATECRDDILAHCAEVQIGEGRVLECLDANAEVVSASCKQAISDVLE